LKNEDLEKMDIEFFRALKKDKNLSRAEFNQNYAKKIAEKNAQNVAQGTPFLLEYPPSGGTFLLEFERSSNGNMAEPSLARRYAILEFFTPCCQLCP